VKRFHSLVALEIKQLQVGRGLVWELSVVCAVVELVLSGRQQMVSGFMPSVLRYQKLICPLFTEWLSYYIQNLLG